MEIHPDEAPVRRLIYELFKEHKRLKTVAEFLNAAGHRGRKGKPFRDTTVEQLLTDPTAKGVRRANYTKMVKGKRVLKPESEWIFVPCPAIISEELWEECNALLQARKASHKPVAKRAVYVFAGYVYCACGEKMYVRSNTPKYVCMACRTKIPMVDLDQVFQGQLESSPSRPRPSPPTSPKGAKPSPRRKNSWPRSSGSGSASRRKPTSSTASTRRMPSRWMGSVSGTGPWRNASRGSEPRSPAFRGRSTS